ncbi:MAG: hypothetical protein ACRYHQ_37280, partial [Janthinobacterium lividum]
REWVARFAALPDGSLNEDAARAELSRQLGPVWTGVAEAAPHVRCLFATFVLHAARRREDALDLLGEMAESLPIDTRDGPAGPAQSLALGDEVVGRADAVLQDSDLVAPCTAAVARHGFTAPALMSLLLHARSEAGVLAPGQFAFLRLVDRPLWYALHSLGDAAPMPNPRVEALGSRDHWAAECALGRPLRLPALDTALASIRVRLKQAASRKPRSQETA